MMAPTISGSCVCKKALGVVMLAKPVNIFTGFPVWPMILIGGAFMTITVYIGMEAIEWVSKIAVPAIIILGIMSMYKAITGAGGMDALMAIEPKAPLTIAAGVAMGVGSFISGATVTPDFTRFSKNTKVAMISTVSAFIFGNALMFFFGAFGALISIPFWLNGFAHQRQRGLVASRLLARLNHVHMPLSL